MGRQLTLDEYLKAFTDEETDSVQDAISVRVSDAEVHSLGLLFIQLMGGLAQCLRRPPKKIMRRKRMPGNQEPASPDGLMTDVAENVTNDDDDLIN
jgi:hypothetical protein